jgi:hypothetical protein
LPRDKVKIDAHIAQWKHNRSLIPQVPATHPDWIVTVAFYVAVHAVDSVLEFEESPACNHETRFKAIAKINRMRKIGELYHPLYDLCRKIRYTADPNQWIRPENIYKYVIKGYLLPLERSAINLLGKTIDLPEIDLSHLGPLSP